jgi:hypothetical protein
MAFHSFGGWNGCWTRSLFGDHHAHGPEGGVLYSVENRYGVLAYRTASRRQLAYAHNSVICTSACFAISAICCTKNRFFFTAVPPLLSVSILQQN